MAVKSRKQAARRAKTRLSHGMAKHDHVARLMKGAAAWNPWRDKNPNVLRLNLSRAILSGANLGRASEVDERLREPPKPYQPKDRRGREAGKPIPLPRADPRKQAGVMADSATSLDLLKQVSQNFASTATMFGGKIDGVKLAVDSAPRQFTTVFDTGAKAVGDAGTVAADALAGRAGGIGSTLGNAGGRHHREGMPVNVNVNVNNKGGPDTGAQKTAGGD